MPNPGKIQPINFNALQEAPRKPVLLKSRFKRLLERQFSKDKPSGGSEQLRRDAAEDIEPSSVCLTRMVQNYIEENNEKPPRCGRSRCNCFNGADSSDEEQDSYACVALKSLVTCVSVSEIKLLVDTVNIVESNKISKDKDEFCRKIVADGLIALGYNASICKSEWEKSPSYLAGMYEYVDVMINGERLIMDIDFRSEFEIARSTKAYKLVLQSLPEIFVGKADRLERIIEIVSIAAKQSLKKNGMPVPPWRKAEYVKAKWLSRFSRVIATIEKGNSLDGELDLLFSENCPPVEEKLDNKNGVLDLFNSNTRGSSLAEKNVNLSVKEWKPPEIRPKSLPKGVKIVTGLASLIEN